MENNELYHWGVKGMKWGQRRYQNKDGTLTAAGKKRYNKEVEKLKNEEQVIKNRERVKASMARLEAKKAALNARKKALDDDDAAKKSEHKEKPAKAAKPSKGKKTPNEMTDEELSAAIRRAELEKRYSDLNPQKVSFGKKIMDTVAVPALTQAGKTLAQDFLIKKGKELLGLQDSDDGEAAFQKLKREADTLKYKKYIKDNTIKDDSDGETKKTKIKDESDGETKKTKTKIKDESDDGSTKKSKTDDTEWFSGTVTGEGTSRRSSAGSKWANDTVIDADWWEVPSSSASNSRRAQLGESYVHGLLPEKRKRD